MSQMEIAQRLKGMKRGGEFSVGTNKERIIALNVAKVLRNAGTIDFQIVTRKNENNGFTIAAIGA